MDAKFTSPNYAINFFGYGNETLNLNSENDDVFDLDYNRVKLRTIQIAPALQWHGELGSKVKLGLSYESIEVEETEGRFINTIIGDNVDVYNNFVGAEMSYGFENRDNKAFPTLGMETNIKVGYKTNIDDSNGFGYIIPSIAFDYKLDSGGQLVLATKVSGHFNLGDDFNVGVYGGLDYGRVWVDNEDSDKWNNSIGGGLFFNGADMIVGNISAFSSNDGLRLAFKIGFGF